MTIKVKDLIEKLKDFPEDTDVNAVVISEDPDHINMNVCEMDLDIRDYVALNFFYVDTDEWRRSLVQSTFIYKRQNGYKELRIWLEPNTPFNDEEANDAINQRQEAVADTVNNDRDSARTLIELADCAWAWEKDARIIGNIRAEDLREMCKDFITRLGLDKGSNS